jgi:hypothetical protein
MKPPIIVAVPMSVIHCRAWIDHSRSWSIVDEAVLLALALKKSSDTVAAIVLSSCLQHQVVAASLARLMRQADAIPPRRDIDERRKCRVRCKRGRLLPGPWRQPSSAFSPGDFAEVQLRRRACDGFLLRRACIVSLERPSLGWRAEGDVARRHVRSYRRAILASGMPTASASAALRNRTSAP